MSWDLRVSGGEVRRALRTPAPGPPHLTPAPVHTHSELLGHPLDRCPHGPQAGTGAPRAPGHDMPQQTPTQGHTDLETHGRIPGEGRGLAQPVPCHHDQSGRWGDKNTWTVWLLHAGSGQRTILMKDVALPSCSPDISAAQAPGSERSTRHMGLWQVVLCGAHGDPAGRAGHCARTATSKPQGRTENCRQEIHEGDPRLSHTRTVCRNKQAGGEDERPQEQRRAHVPEEPCDLRR